MAKKIIVWSAHAEQELKDVLDFYNERNRSNLYSHKLLAELNALLKTLSENPQIGKLAENQQTRVLIFGVFLIFYEIDETQIQILSFWDNRQNPEKRLDQ